MKKTTERHLINFLSSTRNRDICGFSTPPNTFELEQINTDMIESVNKLSKFIGSSTYDAEDLAVNIGQDQFLKGYTAGCSEGYDLAAYQFQGYLADLYRTTEGKHDDKGNPVTAEERLKQLQKALKALSKNAVK